MENEVLLYSEFTLLSNIGAVFAEQIVVLLYSEFTLLSNLVCRLFCLVYVLLYSEFTLLSNMAFEDWRLNNRFTVF